MSAKFACQHSPVCGLSLVAVVTRLLAAACTNRLPAVATHPLRANPSETAMAAATARLGRGFSGTRTLPSRGIHDAVLEDYCEAAAGWTTSPTQASARRA